MKSKSNTLFIALAMVAIFLINAACGLSFNLTIGETTPAAPEICTTAACAPDTTVDTSNHLAFFAGGHQGWEGGPENVNMAGTLNLEELRNGISMQARWSEWFFGTSPLFRGYTVPTGFEPCNDGCPQILLVGETVYIPNRNPAEDAVHFWEISYIELTDAGLLICTDDDGQPGSFVGNCTGTKEVLKGFPMSEISVRLPADLQHHWGALIDVSNNTNVVPEYGSINITWMNPE